MPPPRLDKFFLSEDDLKRLQLSYPRKIYLTDESLLEDFGKGMKEIGRGAEHLVFRNNDHIIKLVLDTVTDMQNDWKEKFGGYLERDLFDGLTSRFEKFNFEFRLPRSPYVTTAIAVSPLYSVELARDMDLEVFIRDFNAPDIKTRMKMCGDVYRGLSVIHNSGVVHLDIKPANIFVSDENLSIGDYGQVAPISSLNKFPLVDIHAPPDKSKRRGVHIDLYSAAVTSIEILSWRIDIGIDFEKLRETLNNVNRGDTVKLCKLLRQLFDGYTRIMGSVPDDVLEEIRCAILGKECDILCNPDPFKMAEVFDKYS